MDGQQFISSDVARRRAGRAHDEMDLLHRLTTREREVFLLLAEGKTPKQAAAALGVGPKTVYIHRASLMGKLGVGSELDLYRLAIERGYLKA
jgi:two-component system uhpT operon response regulator UhpA